jgi:hypothetical protein
MDLAIAIGQGVGLAVACGLVALLPLAVGSLGALAGLVPGALGVYDDAAVAIGTVVAGGANAALSPRLAGTLKLLLAAVAGAGVFELAAGDEVPYAGLAIGAVLAAAAARVASRIVDPAATAGSAGGIATIVAGAGLVAAAVALIPFAGYVLVLVAAWFGRRARRTQERKYAGLRVLR